jgi:antitoxin (DNA-binding transcriptional repressor) of toxin-antitoxin stability system
MILCKREIFMRQSINATQAVRSFSELLNEIKYKGTTYTIERSGKPIAELAPVPASAKKRTLSELHSILDGLPKLGDGASAFSEDVEAVKRAQPLTPTGVKWD